MKLGKRIAAAVIAAATAITALSVSAFAADVVGTNPTKLKEGEQATALIPYDESSPFSFDDGANYKDFSFTVPEDGELKVTFDMSCNMVRINCYSADTLQKLPMEDYESKTGSWNRGQDYFDWDNGANVYSGIVIYKVTKGDYYIRMSRHSYEFAGMRRYGSEGNGRLHIMAEMVKPDAPQDIQVAEKTDTTAKLQWREPETATSYDLRYKAGDGKWTTVTDIMDNNVTIKKLTGATKYTYQMRSHAGEIVGEWSKAASFKTNDPKNVKFDTPKVDSSISVHITWKSVKNATGYKVQYSTDQKNWKTLTVTDTAADIPVVSGKTYYYKVAAKNSAKTGSYSKVQSVKIG